MQNDEIQQIFFLECEEGLAAAEQGLIACQSGEQDAETINTIFRAVHSIKGGAGAFGFSALQSFTHHFETVLDLVRNNELELTRDLVNILLSAFDMLSDHVSAIRGEGDIPNDASILETLVALSEGRMPEGAGEDGAAEAAAAEPAFDDGLSFNLDDLIGGLDIDPVDELAGYGEKTPEPVAEPAAEMPWRVLVNPTAGALNNGGEPLLLLRELRILGGTCAHVDHSAIPTLDAFDANESYLRWTFSVPGERAAREDIEDIFDFVGELCPITIDKEAITAPAPPPPAAPAPVAAAPVVAAPVVEEIVEEVKAAADIAPAPTPAPAPKPAAEQAAPEAVAALASAPSAQRTAPPASQTIRVDLEKLDRLVNTVGELVITQAMLAQRLLNCGIASIDELNDLDHLTRELQDSAMSIRAQPVKSVFSRVPRIVRELEAETGKRVRLEVDGEATELDKTVVERIGEPLTHLIRNAIDHGLETPDERIAAGKKPEGVVRLWAEHKGGRILICVADDGRGINRERVYAKAVERGLISPDARLSDEEIDNLIFAPGFSTAAVVSNISGRGVGMDVVRQNVQALGGRISIQSRPGHGSVFTLALPLTLAILDGMIVSVGDQTFVIPLTHIVESLRPVDGDIKMMGVGKRMLNVRGSFLPVQPIGERLDIPGARQRPEEAVLIVVESESYGQAVLMVDEIRDQRQVVIKSLETNFRQVDGVAGATILGDGRVALILDVDSLMPAQHKLAVGA